MEKQWINFNINEIVKVKLTESGLRILEIRHNSLRTVVPSLGEFVPPKADKDGFSEFQLHDLMTKFGDFITLGITELIPFRTNIKFEFNPDKNAIDSNALTHPSLKIAQNKELIYCKHGGADTSVYDFNIPIGDNQELILCRQCHLVLIGAVAKELTFGNRTDPKEINERELAILNKQLNSLGIELSEEKKLNIIKCAKDMNSVSGMGLDEAREIIIKAIHSYQ